MSQNELDPKQKLIDIMNKLYYCVDQNQPFAVAIVLDDGRELSSINVTKDHPNTRVAIGVADLTLANMNLLTRLVDEQDLIIKNTKVNENELH